MRFKPNPHRGLSHALAPKCLCTSLFSPAPFPTQLKDFHSEIQKPTARFYVCFIKYLSIYPTLHWSINPSFSYTFQSKLKTPIYIPPFNISACRGVFQKVSEKKSLNHKFIWLQKYEGSSKSSRKCILWKVCRHFNIFGIKMIVF